MKIGFYPKLAFDGIRKNARLYVPYFLTSTVMIVMHYIILFLSSNKAVSAIRGGDIIQSLLGMGGGIMAVFSCLFLFYTNSFLIKRRKKEFGLYNVLGMGKKNIALLMMCESIICAAISLILGLGIGILFSKLFELGLVNVMRSSSISYDFSVSLPSVIRTAAVFGIIFALIFLNSLRQLRTSTAIDLLKSENTGEKPPKGNIFLGLVGAALLAGAYYIAVTVKNPLSAITMFFLAVIMVIIGTYLVMISGSVIILRALQKNKRFYYRPQHFVSVSSMVYRMKRNGGGLASICVLSTMVLVMISSTACLYADTETTIKTRYPRELNYSMTFDDGSMMGEEGSAKLERLKEKIEEYVSGKGAGINNTIDYRCAYTAGVLSRDRIEADPATADTMNAIGVLDGLYEIFFVPLKDYNDTMGTKEALGGGEALVYLSTGTYSYPTISFNRGKTFDVRPIHKMFEPGEAVASIVPSMFIIVNDVEDATEEISKIANYNGDSLVRFEWIYEFDTGAEPERQYDIGYGLFNDLLLNEEDRAEAGGFRSRYEVRETEKADMYALNGGLFYLGVVLSLVFLVATVLIIYYKQLSEGYEDRSRFEIMQKVGMTKKEIKKSISSQILTVFFLPLILAAVHIIFAFPIIYKIISLMFASDAALVLGLTTAGSFLLFTVFYVIIYKVTSGAYYRIVS